MRRRCAAPTALVYPMEGGRGISGRLRDRALARPWASAALSTYALHPRETLVTAEFVRKCHLRGLAVNTWTVNDAVRMRELVALRVNGLITDRPDLALKVTADLDPLRRPGAGLPD